MKADCVDKWVSTVFRTLGESIARTPGYYIVVPVMLFLTLSTGMQRIKYQDDPEYLFSPQNGQSHKDRERLFQLFPQNTSQDFDLSRLVTPEKFGRVIFYTKPGQNILRKGVFDDILKVDQLIKNLSSTWDDDTKNWYEICAKSEPHVCFTNDIFDYTIGKLRLVPEEDQGSNATMGLGIKYPLHFINATREIYFPGGFLGEIRTDENSEIVYSEAINMFYYIESSTRKKRLRAEQWENDFLKAMPKFCEDLEHVNCAYFTSLSLTQELEHNTTNVVPYFSITVFIMLAFTVSTCLMVDNVRSKPWLGMLGCLASGISVLAAFGLTMYVGVEFIAINMAAPFLMLGIGMDDTFVLLAAWRRTDPKKSVVERMGETYSEAAVSITITSLTNFISFIIGAITPFPSVRIFCVYTAVCVLFTYIYQVTFFGACMAIAGYAERRNLHGLFCFPTLPRSLAKDKPLWFKVLCSGGLNPNDPKNPKDNQEHILMVFFRDTWGAVLSKGYVKVMVIACFLVYIAFGIAGCCQLKEGLERYKLATDYSYAKTFFNIDDKFFRKYPYRVQIFTNVTLDYWNPETHEHLMDMLDEFESSAYIGNTELTECWFREFRRQAENNQQAQVFLGSFDLNVKEDYIKALRHMLKVEPFSTFKRDIKFNDDFTEIIASRCIIQATDIRNANDEKEMVLDLRRIAENFPELNLSVYHTLFIFFDQFILVRSTSLQNIIVAALVMVVVAIIFIPNLSCAFWVCFSMASIEIGVLGYMTWWNVNLDSISMVNLIMCIGFSVDYSAHISYAYLTASERDPNAKMREALHSLGMPIFQGSISTVLGIIVLAFAPSYIFLTFFKTVFLVIVFGALHGVVLLPVLLSLTDGICKKTSQKATFGLDGESHAPENGHVAFIYGSSPPQGHQLYKPTFDSIVHFEAGKAGANGQEYFSPYSSPNGTYLNKGLVLEGDEGSLRLGTLVGNGELVAEGGGKEKLNPAYLEEEEDKEEAASQKSSDSGLADTVEYREQNKESQSNKQMYHI
ncbi:patched domain-containing protein 3-like [Varroa jacobsoni]|nr:patched domain-containing protein 3-like isoform X3 [Varroa destructor]XP_022645890.1 patched domain-containing protein 3-like isoform X3 [Varroa destructor]XP_022645897.1 patched domain-containing protein 3-like isoform X3 [Varroa destructor]XP_022645906.1 patched domain-containing protein 3-like isoform X3 [Varroa destructor]XP_022645916.1 patched domain-containing protein 3-like isoform X3 [Varroa destructor]XP_022645926.1 patched domain-containing protein 3-like isoform X3 [Varroa destr